ncbi:glycosyltransferase family A protein [Halorubrum gandharaense]
MTVHSFPLVSAIITTYNRREQLKSAVESVIQQDYPNIEIIVVDDNSDYNIENIFDKYSDAVELVVNNQNRGANWSRSVGISKASGKYMTFLDDDDLWYPSKVRRQVDYFEDNDYLGVVTVGRENTDGTIKIPESPKKPDLLEELLLGSNRIGGFSQIMVKYSAIKQAGLPDIHLSSSQDLEWYIRLCQNCDFGVVEEPLIRYNKDGEDRISSKKFTHNYDSHGRILSVHEDLLYSKGKILKNKALSNKEMSLAKNHIHNEDYQMARGHCLKALKLCPWQPKIYPFILISILGKPAYELAFQFNRILNSN